MCPIMVERPFPVRPPGGLTRSVHDAVESSASVVHDVQLHDDRQHSKSDAQQEDPSAARAIVSTSPWLRVPQRSFIIAARPESIHAGVHCLFCASEQARAGSLVCGDAGENWPGAGNHLGRRPQATPTTLPLADWRRIPSLTDSPKVSDQRPRPAGGGGRQVSRRGEDADGGRRQQKTATPARNDPIPGVREEQPRRSPLHPTLGQEPSSPVPRSPEPGRHALPDRLKDGSRGPAAVKDRGHDLQEEGRTDGSRSSERTLNGHDGESTPEQDGIAMRPPAMPWGRTVEGRARSGPCAPTALPSPPRRQGRACQQETARASAGPDDDPGGRAPAPIPDWTRLASGESGIFPVPMMRPPNADLSDRGAVASVGI